MNRIAKGLVIEIKNLDSCRGSEIGKIHPFVVVTISTYNECVPVIQVVPITNWNPKKREKNQRLNLSHRKKCPKKQLPTVYIPRSADYRARIKGVRGKLESEIIEKIDQALKIVFDLI